MKNGMDMHEAIITRGDVQGNKRLIPLIMVVENCVLVCPGGGQSKCHLAGHTKAGQRILIADLLTWVEFTNVLRWLIEIEPSFVNKKLIEEAMNLVTEVYYAEKKK
jgi:hypothetical protein